MFEKIAFKTYDGVSAISFLGLEQCLIDELTNLRDCVWVINLQGLGQYLDD